MHRNKMAENSPDTKLNRILKDFKSLDTFVDIGTFLKEMNVVNHKKGAIHAIDSVVIPRSTAKHNTLKCQTKPNLRVSMGKSDSHL
jgi:hypothetical protein